MDPPEYSIPISPAANKNMNPCTGLILHVGSSNRSSSRPQSRLFPRLPDEIILMVCHQVYDGGFGRSALSKLSRTCRRAHTFALPLLYKEIKAMAGCCRPISGRYKPRVPCSCSEEKRNTGFPCLNLPSLVASLLSHPHLASLVETVDLHQQKRSANGQQILSYGGNDCLLPFFFLLPHVKSIKIPSSTSWQRGGKSLAENQIFKAGLLRLAAARDRGFPNITNLHIGNGVRDLWDQTCMWSLISACTNLEILYLERPGGSVQSLIPADPFTADPDEMSFVRHQIHFPNLVDLDIAHSELSSYDFGNMMQSCTRLRRVSVVQFQPASSLSFHTRDVSPGPARIIECLAASAATLEKLSVSWAHKDFSRTFNFRPEIMALIKPMRGFSALRLLELSYKDLEKGEEGVLVNLIKDCDKLEVFKLIGITNMPRRELYHFACHVKEGVFPRLRMLKLCTNIKDSSAWDTLKSIADHDIVSLLAVGQVKLVLRPHHRKPGDPRFPELNFKGDDSELTAPDASSA